MPRLAIVNGWIPDTPTNRLLAEWLEVAATIYFAGQIDAPPMQSAAMSSAVYVGYDQWVRAKLGQ